MGRATAVLAVPLAGTAAIPEPIEPAGSASRATEPADPAGLSRQCFLLQPRWNLALDGAVPRCPPLLNAGRVLESAP